MEEKKYIGDTSKEIPSQNNQNANEENCEDQEEDNPIAYSLLSKISDPIYANKDNQRNEGNTIYINL